MTNYPFATSVSEAIAFVRAHESFKVKIETVLRDALNYFVRDEKQGSVVSTITLHHDSVGYWGYDDEYGLEAFFANNDEECITKLATELKN